MIYERKVCNLPVKSDLLPLHRKPITTSTTDPAETCKNGDHIIQALFLPCWAAASLVQVVCAWKDQGKEVFQRHQPFELARDDGETAATQVFDALLAKCESLQVSSQWSQTQSAGFQQLQRKRQ